MSLNLKKKIYLEGFIFAGLIAALIFFIARPIILEINQMSGKLQEAYKILVEFDQQKNYLESLGKDYEKIEKENDYLSQVLLEPENVVDFIIALEKNADLTNNKLEIGIIVPEEEKPENKKAGIKPVAAEEHTNIPLQLILEGDFNSLMDFLVLLENMEYYVDVSSINIEALKEKVETGEKQQEEKYLGNVKAGLVIKVYTSQKPPSDFW